MDRSQEKEQVAIDYLAGGISYRRLGAKYGYGPSTIFGWVMAGKKKKDKLQLLQAAKVAVKEEMPTDVKQLQEALRDSRLTICLLEAMIDISDEQFGTNIRKKAGHQAVMKVEPSREGSLSRLCSLSGYSRQAYYKRSLGQEEVPLKEELIIQQVVGYRRLQPHIGGKKLYLLVGPFIKQHQLKIGRDAFFGVLRRYGLLNKRRRGKVRTTDSNHWMKKYPDLIKELVPTRSDELWVSDITYLTLCDGDAFLSLVTDAYSRKIVGFHVSKSLQAEGCILALQMAIAGRNNIDGLIHHSDRGSQYCCADYINILKNNKIDISMTQSGDPRDNAIAERVNGVLKIELLEPVFVDIDAARAAVTQAINTYNFLRPHSSISMLTPALVHGRVLKLKRHWKNYYKKRLGKEVVDELVINKNNQLFKKKKRSKKRKTC